MEKQQLWEEFLKCINENVTTVAFNTWFKNLKLLDITNESIIILDPGQTIKDQLMQYYKEIIDEALIEITNKHLNIEFRDSSYLKRNETDYKNNSPDELFNKENELQNLKLVEKRKTNLKEKYRFDNFVVGEANRFAYQSALAVAQNPGKLYNPLFLYGKSGLGKTHLMHAIGNYILENSNLKVLYISTDDFMNDFINITKNKGDRDDNLSYIELFKNKYRDIDVLMIDDIQFLGNAPASQQEFTSTFNDLYYDNKQIIICSDRSVNDLKLFEDRLKTRFNWGLKAIINIPEFELKVKIIQNKIKSDDLMLNLSEEIIDFIANNCGSDVRNLEGMITRLQAYTAIMGIKELTLDDAREALDEFANGRGTYTDNSIGKIMNIVANYFNLRIEDLTGKKRVAAIAKARMIGMYLSRVLLDESLQRIGLEFGGRDHSTVIHAYEKIEKDLKTDSELEKIISELKQKMSE